MPEDQGWETKTRRSAASGKAQAKQEPHKSTGSGNSPRSHQLIAELTPILESYDYGRDDILNLLNRCGWDEDRIQAAVDDIIEDRRGHEQDEWATTATAGERKAAAAEAKKRSEQLKKMQQEEEARESQRRTEEENEKYRRLQEELKRRSRLEEARRLGIEPAKGDVKAPAPKPSSGGSAWQKAAQEAKEAAKEAAAAEAEAPAAAPAAEEPPKQDVVTHELIEETLQQAAAQQSWAPATPMPQSKPDRLRQGPSAQASSVPAAPAGVAPEVPRPEASEAAAPASLWQPKVNGTPAASFEDEVDPPVVMPASYKALIGAGPEPAVMFGSLRSSDGGAASSTKPTPGDGRGADGRSSRGRGKGARQPRGEGGEEGQEDEGKGDGKGRPPRKGAKGEGKGAKGEGKGGEGAKGRGKWTEKKVADGADGGGGDETRPRSGGRAVRPDRPRGGGGK